MLEYLNLIGSGVVTTKVVCSDGLKVARRATWPVVENIATNSGTHLYCIIWVSKWHQLSSLKYENSLRGWHGVFNAEVHFCIVGEYVRGYRQESFSLFQSCTLVGMHLISSINAHRDRIRYGTVMYSNRRLGANSLQEAKLSTDLLH